ncbi:MAG: T9SS type A sorting domain-containing protein [Bacteroidetes bacterium]|nr:T9SS type A sorting domain-containing protein [Bacteroidota bacterium]
MSPCWPNAVEEVKLQAQYKIYPNPVADNLQIEWNLNGDSFGVVQLTDLTGNILLDIPFNPGYQIKSIDLSALNSGIYILRFISKLQSIGYEKIINVRIFHYTNWRIYKGHSQTKHGNQCF